MALTRLIPVLLLENGLLVRSEEFSFHQVIGNPINQLDRFSEWDVDEIIYLDITRDGDQDMRRSDHKVQGADDILSTLQQIADHCFVPLTFGGGIRTMDDVQQRIAHGADKVAINTAAYETPELITEAAEFFGSQAIVVGIDVKDGEVFTNAGATPPASTRPTGRGRSRATAPARSSSRASTATAPAMATTSD